jgi:hypothetical protein
MCMVISLIWMSLVNGCSILSVEDNLRKQSLITIFIAKAPPWQPFLKSSCKQLFGLVACKKEVSATDSASLS